MPISPLKDDRPVIWPQIVGNLIVASVLAYLRISGVKHEAFQAAAHFYVSGLFLSWWYGWTIYKLKEWLSELVFNYQPFDRTSPWFYLVVAVILSLIELGCALFLKVATTA
jgi:hypothetical protein